MERLYDTTGVVGATARLLRGAQDEHEGGTVDEHERWSSVFMLTPSCSHRRLHASMFAGW
jgi:hypothetical protein